MLNATKPPKAGVRPGRSLKRFLLAGWLALFVLGAMNATVIPRFSGGRRMQFWLPHLNRGYVMFNINPPIVTTVHYRPPLSKIRFPIEELVQTPSIGYKTTRVNLNAYLFDDYLEYLCAHGGTPDETEFTIDKHDVSTRPPTVKTQAFLCSGGKLNAKQVF